MVIPTDQQPLIAKKVRENETALPDPARLLRCIEEEETVDFIQWFEQQRRKIVVRHRQY